MTEAPTTGLTWVAYEPTSKASRRTTSAAPLTLNNVSVRKHAALAGAAVRKAKLARQNAVEDYQRRKRDSKSPEHHQQLVRPTVKASKQFNTPSWSKPFNRTQISSTTTGYFNLSLEDTAHRKLASYIASTLARPQIDFSQPGMATRDAHTQLWVALTSSSTLYNAALFMVGMHGNTWGLPPSALDRTLGSGLLLLPGPAREAIQAAVVAQDGDSTNSIAVAMVADKGGSGDVHIASLQLLCVSPGALDVSNLAALTYVVLNGFRSSLNDLSAAYDDLVYNMQGVFPSALPIGFHILRSSRPEATSLHHLVAQAATHDPTSHDALYTVRRLLVELIAWSPSHSKSLSPSPSDESSWDQVLLNAFYHVRAACVSIVVTLVQATFDAHDVFLGFDIIDGLDLHAVSCQQLRTKMLFGTEYEELALWSRYVICAIGRDAASDGILRSWLEQSGVGTWSKMEALLARHLYVEPWIGWKMRGFWEMLHGEGGGLLSPPQERSPAHGAAPHAVTGNYKFVPR